MALCAQGCGLLCLILVPAGCLRQGFGPDQERPDATFEGEPPTPSDTLAPNEGPSPDGAREAQMPDVLVPDALGPDAPPPAPCAAVADPSTLLLLAFEGTGAQVADQTGAHDATIEGTGVSRVAGPPGCGNALAFPASDDLYSVDGYVEIPDAPAWDLDEGSVDFWFRIDSATGGDFRGIVGRDATGTELPGHLLVLQLPDGAIAVRLQTTGSEAVRCTTPLTLGDWHHLGINFGPQGLEAFVDGGAADRAGSVVATSDWALDCGSVAAYGIAGNDNPWVLGASTNDSAEGQATPLVLPFHGALDSFRVSSARRTFGGSGG